MKRSSATLDLPLGDFAALLEQASALVINRYREMPTAPAYAGHSFPEVAAWFDEPLPEQGQDIAALLNRVKTQILDTATNNLGPHMFAYVMAGGTQVSVLAELLTAAINQNVGKWHLAPGMSALEQRVVQWGAEFIGYAPSDAESPVGGILVSGGSAANLMGLTVGRNLFLHGENVRQHGLFGRAPMIVYASTEVHSCVDKSIETLGIGTNNLRKIPVDSDFRIQVPALRAQIAADLAAGFTPFCIVGNAGTVNTGAIDPLDVLADIAAENDMWFHVDGAYGGLAAALPELRPQFAGLDRADSVAVDFHKWLYQPFEAGCTLVRNWAQLKSAWYKRADYLAMDARDDGRLDFNEHGFQLSRSAKALKVWMSYQAYGATRLREGIRNDIANTAYLAAQVTAAPDFELVQDGPLSAVCFRFLGDGSADAEALNRALIPALEADGRVFIAGSMIHGQSVIRACLINHRMQRENVDFLLRVIREVGAAVQAGEAGLAAAVQ